MQHEIREDLHIRQEFAAYKRRAEEIQLLRAKAGSVKRPIMWRALLKRISDRANMDDGLYRDQYSLTVAPDGNSFKLDRSRYPKTRVHAIFRENLLIELHCSYQQSDNARAIEWEKQVEFRVDELDRVSFEHEGKLVSQDDIALLILAPVRDPEFRPPTD